MEWQQNGRRLKTASANGKNLSYAYNDQGIRTQKTVDGVTTEYYLNGSAIYTQVTGSTRLDFLYDDAGDLLGFFYNGRGYYYVRNGQNDITGILNSDGTQVAAYTYDAWGTPTSTTGTEADTIGSLNPFRYRGYYYDAESSLYYLNSRYYDPQVGRFLNADNAVSGIGGEIQGYNLFAYCHNNPINMNDQSGNWPKWIENTAKAVSNAVKKAFTVVVNTVKSAASAVSNFFNSSNKRPNTGEPGSTYRAPNGDSRTFGQDRKPAHDYDHNDHGRADKHPHDENGGHNHDWDWSKDPPRGPAYAFDLDAILLGVAIVTVCTIAFIAVAADDVTGVGVANDFLFAPLGAGISKGLVMVFG